MNTPFRNVEELINIINSIVAKNRELFSIEDIQSLNEVISHLREFQVLFKNGHKKKSLEKIEEGVITFMKFISIYEILKLI